MSTTSSSPTASSSIPVQPDHFYGKETSTSDKGYFDPNDDPSAFRGIPVFKPNIEDFEDFEGYLNKVECWGMKSGIVKIIPPPEWTSLLPSTKPQLKHIRLRNPIEQDFTGSGGLFRQQNIEKRRIMSVREWADQCGKEDMRAPTVEEAQGGRRHAAPLPRGAKGRAKRTANVEVKTETDGKHEEHDGNIDAEGEPDEHDEDPDNTTTTPRPMDVDGDVDPASTLPTPPATTVSHSPANAALSPPATVNNSNSPPATVLPTRRTASERHRAREILDDAFLSAFDPHKDWLPKDMKPEDYTPEFCRTLEKIYWRSCGFGKAPWYGADMKGSLFTPATKHWNVATLPSALSRLLGSDSQISGVNTPYLYFGMWRATFAWHVEDMDLFSINYIHFGAPKFWYAMPQSRAANLETTMKGYFPLDTSTCPQFLRHKSFLASPPKLGSARPNTLVQHAGEFVVTFPRGYHAGFNLGFNCAESVNFALESWIELGKKAAYCACVEDSVRIDVARLLKEREKERNGERNDENKHENGAGTTPNKKRKVEVVVEGESLSKAKRSKTSADSASTNSTASLSKARPKSNPSASLPSSNSTLHFPCCLCPSLSTHGLLRVHDPPSGSNTPSKPPPGIPWRAHEICARVVPETWVDEDPDTASGIDGEKERVIWGVDGIVKDRWMLKCSVCTRPSSKLHGAPIQCTKGKCSKAFHVSCAADAAASPPTTEVGAGIGYRVLEEIEKEVVLIDDAMNVDPPTATSAGEEVLVTTNAADSDVQLSSSTSTSGPTPSAPRGPNVIKTIKKLLVEVLCSQHNPASIALKKASKDERLTRDIDALKEMDRIRIRNSSGVFEVSLVQVNKERRTVEVLWDGGQKREFKWGSIVWSWNGETGKKPTAEEIAKNPPPPPSAPSRPKPKPVASTSRYRPSAPLVTPVYNAYPPALFSFQTQLFQQQQQVQQQGQGQSQSQTLQPLPQATPNVNGRAWYQGMSQFRVAPQPPVGTKTPSTSSASTSTSTPTSASTTKPPATTTAMPAPMPLTAMPLPPYHPYYPPYYSPQYLMYAAHQAQTQAHAHSQMQVQSGSSAASTSTSAPTSTTASITASSAPKPITTAVPTFAVPLTTQAQRMGTGPTPYYPVPYAHLPLPGASASAGSTSYSPAPYLQLTPRGVGAVTPTGTGFTWPAYARGKGTENEGEDQVAGSGLGTQETVMTATTAPGFSETVDAVTKASAAGEVVASSAEDTPSGPDSVPQ